MKTKELTNSPLVLQAQTAAELMTPNPISLRHDATLHEALAFLVDRNISGAPVIDEAGRPVGVLSRTDLLVHQREEVQHVTMPEVDHGTPLPPSMWEDFQVERVDTTPVSEVMTPAVFCVSEHATSVDVVRQMCERNVHRLFVVDADGALTGVISAMDVLRALEPGA